MTAAARQQDFNLATPGVKPAAVPSGVSRPASAPQSIRRESFAARATRHAMAAAALAAIAFGFVQSRQDVFTPKDGVGYWLGIIGGTLLLAQLLYPFRKRLPAMRGLGSPRSWFRTHMVLGIVAPIVILYHCNFAIGATNSNVALFSLLIVAASGLVGRYIYGHIHAGLYGARAQVQDILADASGLLQSVESDVGGTGGAVAMQLTRFAEFALKPRRSLAANIWLALRLTAAAPFVRARAMSRLRASARQHGARDGWNRRERNARLRSARGHLDSLIAAIVKAAELSLYERLFRFWHVLHTPLFCLLILTGIAHIVAVHLY